VKDVVFSEKVALAVTSSGSVFSWGNGQNGKLGKKNASAVVEPMRLEVCLKEEQKRVREVKQRHQSVEEIEELMMLQSFVSAVGQQPHFQ